jgi:hypothetical protein
MTTGKKETVMLVDFIGAAREQRHFAPLGEGEQMWA